MMPLSNVPLWAEGQVVASAGAKNNRTAFIMVCDIDNLGQVNNEWRHETGDIVIEHVVHCARTVFSSGELLHICGGDELIVCVEGLRDDTSIHSLAERFRKEVEHDRANTKCPVTISIGVAEIRMNDSFITWLRRAECALFRAKLEGKNAVRFA